MKVLCAGNGKYKAELFTNAAETLGSCEKVSVDLDYQELQKVEKVGTDNMPVPECIKEGKDIEIALVHYCTISREGLSYMPNLKIAATCRSGFENFDVSAMTEKGIVCICISCCISCPTFF